MSVGCEVKRGAALVCGARTLTAYDWVATPPAAERTSMRTIWLVPRSEPVGVHVITPVADSMLMPLGELSRRYVRDVCIGSIALTLY